MESARIEKPKIRMEKCSGKLWKGYTRYRKLGHKIREPVTPEQFYEAMTHGSFLKEYHKPYPVLLYYSAVRETEALRVTPEDFAESTRTALYFDVGDRLKGSERTDPLKLPLSKPFMSLLKDQIDATAPRERVFPFKTRTAYNIMDRSGLHYPHLLRLTRITDLFQQHFTIAEVKSWTGLSLRALNFYVGKVDIERMGDRLT